MKVQNDINTYKISWLNYCEGGRIRSFYEPESKTEFVNLVRSFQKTNTRFFVVGHTSNIYFTPTFSCDVCITTRRLKDVEFSDNIAICDCGVPVSTFANTMIDRGYVGFEGLIDLPGTIGGAVYGNSSCFGCSINEMIQEVEVIDSDGNIRYLAKEELQLAERSSIFKRNGGVILSAKLCLIKGNSVELRQQAIANHQYRMQTQPGRQNNLGCVFKGFAKSKLTFRGLLFKVLSKSLALIKYGTHRDSSYIELEKHYLLKIMGLPELEKYLYSYNQFIWSDAESHRFFPKYVSMMQKLYNGIDLEIEIL